MTMPDRAALDACVTRAAQQVVVRAALYLGDEELTAVSLGGGSVKADARRTQTRDASLELLPDGTHDVDDLYRLVSVPGTTVKLWRGFVLADASELLVPLGVFSVEDAELKETSSGSSLSVSCADLSVRIARAVWSDPLQIAAGTNLAAAITSILQDRWPLVATDMSEEVYLETLGAQVTLGTSTSSDPWADACGIAESHGYQLMFDVDGVAVLRAQPSATTAPVFSFAPGATAIMTERSRATKLSETYNGVVATGEGSEIATPVRAEAWDDDPASPTYRYGLFGQVPYLYSSSLLTTQAKAQAAADAKLAQLLGRSTSLSWSQIVHPGLAPLDVVEVETVVSRTVTRPRPGTPATLVPHHTNTDSDRDTWYDLSGNDRDATVKNPYTAGYLLTSATQQNIGADKKLGFRVYVATPMTLTKFTAYLDNTGAGHAACNVRPVLYSDTAGEPDDLVAYGDPVAVADNAAVAWVDVPIAASLTPGFYWMFLHGDGTAAGLNARINTSGTYNAVRQNADTYSDGPSDPAGACTAINGRLCLYLTASNFSLWTGDGETTPYGLALNGSTQFAQTTAFAQSSGEWTIEAWAVNAGQRIGWSQNAMALCHGSTDTDGWYWQQSSASSPYIRLNRDSASQTIYVGGGVPVGTLTHLVFRCDNESLKGQWSKNGVHQSAVDLAAAMVPPTEQPFYVGVYGGLTQYCAPWTFHAVRYYSRKLTDAEVEQSYAAGVTGLGYAKDDLALDLNAARVIPGSAPIPGGVTVTTETKRYILDSIDMPLSIGGTMSATARELRT